MNPLVKSIVPRVNITYSSGHGCFKVARRYDEHSNKHYIICAHFSNNMIRGILYTPIKTLGVYSISWDIKEKIRIIERY